MRKVDLTVCIIAKNEEQKIEDALKSAKWADELLLIDTGSTDKTVNIAKRHNAKIVTYTKGSFNDWRNRGMQEASGEWILYLDADERITPLLKDEIQQIIQPGPSYNAYAIPRRNYIFGKEFRYGGEWPDHQIRLLKVSKLKEWTGEVHEKPQFEGELGYLEQPMVHLKHDNLEEMVEKTNKWSEIEAKLIFENGHPEMAAWRFVRIMLTEVFDRFIKKQGFRDGKEGVIYSTYQVWSRFLTYAKLWEMQIINSKLKSKN